MTGAGKIELTVQTLHVLLAKIDDGANFSWTHFLRKSVDDGVSVLIDKTVALLGVRVRKIIANSMNNFFDLVFGRFITQ